MFSTRLTQLRNERGLTRKEIAEKLNIDQTTYGKYELSKRQPDYQMLEKLASFFGVSIDYLLGRSHERNPDISYLNETLPSETRSLIEEVLELNEEQKEIIRKLIKEFVKEK